MSEHAFLGCDQPSPRNLRAGDHRAVRSVHHRESRRAAEVSGTLERQPVPHRVALPGDFYLAEFPVTNGMCRQFVKETAYREPSGELVDLGRIKTGKGFSSVILVSEGVAARDRNEFSAGDQPGVHF
jgi:formylglycine-generating enzyme required for sulfatase activity